MAGLGGRPDRRGAAGDAAQRDTFEVGALLIGRASMVRWFVLTPEQQREAREAAERAIEIADRIGSTRLLSHALEALGWRDADSGFCLAGETADRMLDLVAKMSDRVEAAETVVIAAVCLLRAGRFEEARQTAADATALARHLSPHRRLHAASAATVCLLGPAGSPSCRSRPRRPTTSSCTRAARTCAMASLALAGHAVARFAVARPGGRRAGGPQRRGDRPPSQRLVVPVLGIEVLRPFVGSSARACGSSAPDSARDVVDGVHQLRALRPARRLGRRPRAARAAACRAHAAVAA